MNKTKWIIIISVIVVTTSFVYLTRDENDQEGESIQKEEMVKMQNQKIMEYTDLEAKEAHELIMSESDLVIIDVSPRFEKGHIPGAINYYVGDGTLDANISSLDKSKIYLVYCHVDRASIAGATKLVEAGFPKVYRLKGNYSAWLSDGYPIEVEIKSVGDYNGSALSTRSFLDGKFKHMVKAKISDPAEGKFYEGWLVKGTSFFSTGKLIKSGEFYRLGFESDDDSRDYKSIVITEETESDGLDGKPETHVLEGEFE